MTPTPTLLLDDPVIQAVRATRQELAQACAYEPRKLAEAIRQKGAELRAQFGLPLLEPNERQQS